MKFSLVIPAFNEAENIEAVVRDSYRALHSTEKDFEIIVVDNGSEDSTPQILSRLRGEIPNLRIKRVFPNRGYGNGIRSGLKEARGEILGWIDGDGQLNCEDLVKVYAKCRDENLDLCVGARDKRSDSWFRLVQSAVYNFLFKILFGGTLRDINSKPKIFRRGLYEKLSLESNDWFIDPELVIKAVGAGARVGEVGVRWNSRRGRSKVSLMTAVEFIKNMLLYKFFK